MRAALRLLINLTGMFLGVAFLALNVDPSLSQPIGHFLGTPAGRIVAASFAAVLLLTPLALALRWWQVARRSSEISYNTDSGRISVSLIAIEEALGRAIEGEPEVKKAHVRVYEDRVKRAVVVYAAVTLWEVPNLTERNRFFQRLLRRRFSELMPEQTDVQVNLSVHRLNVRRAEPATAAALPARGNTATPDAVPAVIAAGATSAIEPDSDDELFVGPSYPVLREGEDDELSTQTYLLKPPRKDKGKT